MIDRWRALPPYPRRVLVRLACVPVLWFLLLTLVFVLLEVMFDPTEGLIGDFGPGDIERYRESLGLNRPVLERYGDFWQRILTSDYGRSFVNDRPITESLQTRYSVSLELLVLTMAFSIATAFAIGLVGRLHATPARIVASLLSAVPIFAVVILALYWPLEWWDYAPPIGEDRPLMDDPIGNLKLFIPPALIAGITVGAWSSRLVAQTLRSESSITSRLVAIACGRAAADCLPLALGSLIVLERTYALPGLGDYLHYAAFSRSTSALEAVLVFAFAVGLLGWAVRPLPPTSHAVASAPTVGWRWNKRPLFVVGLALVVVMTLIAIVGPLLSDADAYDLAGMRDENPSWDHPLGTDKLGRDVLARTLMGTRTSLTIAAIAAVFGAFPGWALGFCIRLFDRAFQVFDELAAAWLAIPLLPWFFLWIWALYSGGWRLVAIPTAIHCFMVGFRLTRSLEPTGEWRNRVRDPMARWTLLAACSVAAAIAIASEALATYIGFYDLHRISLGQEIYRSRGSVPLHDLLILAPMFVLTALVSAFLLIRTSLDDDVPARTYER